MMKIEKGLPVPKSGLGRKSKYPWADMEVGDSVLIGNTHNCDSARIAAHSYGRRHNIKFISRVTNKGLRVWRTE